MVGWLVLLKLLLKWLNGLVITVFLRVSTVSQSTAWTTQRHSSPQPCGWVFTRSFCTHLFPLLLLMIGSSWLTRTACCFPAHYTPGAVDIHCNQPGQCLHQGRKQTPGGEFEDMDNYHFFFLTIIIFLTQLVKDQLPFRYWDHHHLPTFKKKKKITLIHPTVGKLKKKKN